MRTPVMTCDVRLLRTLLRQSFNAFVEKAFATLAAGQFVSQQVEVWARCRGT
jgi:hypothetical protein